MLNYNHLYYFHVTATEGTVARAAEKLGVGQPTVSEQIRQLERNLGTSLFDRSGGKLKLSAVGRSAFEYTSIMFRASERLVQSLVGVKTPPPLSLRVGISSAVARSVATDFLMPLLSLDDCMPQIHSGETNELLRDLRAHDLDLLLAEADPGERARPDLEVVSIHKPRLVAVASASKTPEPKWANLQLVHYRPSSVYRHFVDEYLSENDLDPRIAAETDDALVMMAAVLRGGFAAFVPWSVAREAVGSESVNVIAELKPDDVAVLALFHAAESATIVRRAVEQLVAYAKKIDAE